MTIVLIMITVFAVSMISAAWVIPRKRGARADRETAEDAAIRDLYDHYIAGVDSLTQAYLLRAPSDEEWLAGIRDKGVSAARERPKDLIRPLPVHAVPAGILYGDAQRRRHRNSETFWRRAAFWLRVSGMSLLPGILIAMASFWVLSHLAASWLLVLGIAAPMALGVLAGRAVGFRPSLPGDPFEPDRQRARRPREPR